MRRVPSFVLVIKTRGVKSKFGERRSSERGGRRAEEDCFGRKAGKRVERDSEVFQGGTGSQVFCVEASKRCLGTDTVEFSGWHRRWRGRFMLAQDRFCQRRAIADDGAEGTWYFCFHDGGARTARWTLCSQISAVNFSHCAVEDRCTLNPRSKP